MAERDGGSRLTHSGVAAVLASALLVPAFATAADASTTAAADRGERLFAGRTRFANGGPACAECHDVAGLPFPHGGSVGPELSRTYSKYGPVPLEAVLSTLYFPTMQALFAGRPLTPDERRDLAAMFQRADTLRAHRSAAPPLAVAALLGAVVLLGAASVTWRGRLRGVRRSIVAKAKARPGS